MTVGRVALGSGGLMFRGLVAVAAVLLLAGCTAPGVFEDDRADAPAAESAAGAPGDAGGSGSSDAGDGVPADVTGPGTQVPAGFCPPAVAWYDLAFEGSDLTIGRSATLDGPVDPELSTLLSAEFEAASRGAAAAAAGWPDGPHADVLGEIAVLSGAVAAELSEPGLPLGDLLVLLLEPPAGSASYDLATVLYSPEVDLLFEAIEDLCLTSGR